MNNHGFIRVAAAVPSVQVADTRANAEEICRLTAMAEEKNVSLLLFPELSVTGYTCGDLFTQQLLITEAEKAVRKIMDFSRGKSVTVVTGAPVRFNGQLYDCAIVIRNGNVKGIVPKTWLSRDKGESRWFSSGKDFLSGHMQSAGRYLVNGKDTVREGFCAEIRYAGFRCNISPDQLFEVGGTVFGIEIGCDRTAPVAPSSYHCLAGAQIILNPSAEAEIPGNSASRIRSLEQLSARNICGYVFCSAGKGESTQDYAFAGPAAVFENGRQIAGSALYLSGPVLTIADLDMEVISNARQKAGFHAVTPDGTSSEAYYGFYSRNGLGNPADTDFSAELYREVEKHPFCPEKTEAERNARFQDITSAQVAGLAARLEHIHCRSAVVGISGGLDSTLALLVTVLAFDKLGWERKRIIGVTMPGYGTTGRTKNNAVGLMETLGITMREIPIAEACDRHFLDIGHDKNIHDVTFENSQARERTQILMDVANQTGGIVIGTGDLSELALGWATYNGDHMSMYGVNASVPKTLVSSTVKWAAEHLFTSSDNDRRAREILLDIVDTPISPELLPADDKGNIQQKTEDLVGPYELHDFFLYNTIEYGYAPEKTAFMAKKAFCQDGTYDEATVERWLSTFFRRFFQQQFKRSCLPDGAMAGPVSLSPRGGWVMPSDARNGLFTDNLK